MVRPEYSGLALKVVHFDRSGNFCPFPFDKVVVPRTFLLSPVQYKDINQTRGGFGRVCTTGMSRGMYSSIGHVEFPKFQNGIFVEWKAPIVYQMSTTFFSHFDVVGKSLN